MLLKQPTNESDTKSDFCQNAYRLSVRYKKKNRQKSTFCTRFIQLYFIGKQFIGLTLFIKYDL